MKAFEKNTDKVEVTEEGLEPYKVVEPERNYGLKQYFRHLYLWDSVYYCWVFKVNVAQLLSLRNLESRREI